MFVKEGTAKLTAFELSLVDSLSRDVPFFIKKCYFCDER